MNSIDAAHSVVHDYPGGSESLGPRVGISAAVLRSKVNPNNTTHHLSFAEARRISGMTDDYRMLKAWANEAGFLLVKAPEGAADSSDMAILEQVAVMMVAQGSFAHEIHKALADGEVTQEEMLVIESLSKAYMSCVASIKTRMRGYVA